MHCRAIADLNPLDQGREVSALLDREADAFGLGRAGCDRKRVFLRRYVGTEEAEELELTGREMERPLRRRVQCYRPYPRRLQFHRLHAKRLPGRQIRSD